MKKETNATAKIELMKIFLKSCYKEVMLGEDYQYIHLKVILLQSKEDVKKAEMKNLIFE